MLCTSYPLGARHVSSFGSHNDLVLMNDYCESIVISKALVRVEVETHREHG